MRQCESCFKNFVRPIEISHLSAYMYEPPPFPVLRQILVAANFYKCHLYAKQAQRAILVLFPDEPNKVALYNLSFIVEATKLGRIHTGLQGLLRCTFYHLARKTFKREAGDPDYDGERLESLPGSELVILLELQRQLASSWDGISTILQANCACNPKCSRQPLSATTRNIYLFDPIHGINKVIKQDWISNGFCVFCMNDATSKLKKERTKIWDNVQTLVTPPRTES